MEADQDKGRGYTVIYSTENCYWQWTALGRHGSRYGNSINLMDAERAARDALDYLDRDLVTAGRQQESGETT